MIKDTRKTALVACRRKALLVTKNGLHAAASAAANPDPRNLARQNVDDVHVAENKRRGLAADGEAARVAAHALVPTQIPSRELFSFMLGVLLMLLLLLLLLLFL